MDLLGVPVAVAVGALRIRAGARRFPELAICRKQRLHRGHGSTRSSSRRALSSRIVPRKKSGFIAPVQPHGIREGELAEVPLVDAPVLDQLPGLLEHLRGIGHVEVRDVGAEQRPELQAQLRVERERGQRIVGLAAEVEALREQPPHVVAPLDVHAREFVGVAIALGQLLLRDVALEVVEIAREDVVELAREAPIASRVALEQAPQLGPIDVRGREPLGHEPAVALLPVTEQIGVQVARPADAAFEEREVQRRESAPSRRRETDCARTGGGSARSARGGSNTKLVGELRSGQPMLPLWLATGMRSSTNRRQTGS